MTKTRYEKRKIGEDICRRIAESGDPDLMKLAERLSFDELFRLRELFRAGILDTVVGYEDATGD